MSLMPEQAMGHGVIERPRTCSQTPVDRNRVMRAARRCDSLLRQLEGRRAPAAAAEDGEALVRDVQRQGGRRDHDRQRARKQGHRNAALADVTARHRLHALLAQGVLQQFADEGQGAGGRVEVAALQRWCEMLPAGRLGRVPAGPEGR